MSSSRYQRRSHDYDSPRTASLYYRPSGRMPLAGPLVMVLIGGLGAAFLGAVYGSVTLAIPCKPVNALLAVVFAFLMGIAAMVGYNAAKIRSPLTVLVVGTMIGVTGLYVEWSAWAYQYLDKTGGAEQWLFSPARLWEIMIAAAGRGMWPVKDPAPGSTMSIIVIGIIGVFWALEALLVLIFSAYIPWSDCHASPFCETCGAWAEDKVKEVQVELPPDPEMFRLDLEAGPTAALARLGEPALDAYLKVGIKACGKCQAQGWLNAEAVTEILDQSGQKTKREQAVVKNLILGPEVEEIIRRFQWGKGPEGPEGPGNENVTE